LVARADHDVILIGLFTSPTDDVAAIQCWRDRALHAGILALTAGHDVARTVQIIENGADDCVAAPFHPDELVARLVALSRRRTVVRIHDLQIDSSARTVHCAGQSIQLTPREYDLLQFLVFHHGRLVTRRMILDHLYHAERHTSNVVAVYIRYLRCKIDRGFDEPLILTCWGQGYMLRADAPKSLRKTRQQV